MRNCWGSVSNTALHQIKTYQSVAPILSYWCQGWLTHIVVWQSVQIEEMYLPCYGQHSNYCRPRRPWAPIYISFWALLWETSRNMNILMVSMIIHHVYLYSHCWEVCNHIFSRWRRTRNPSHCRQNPFSWKFEDGDKISKFGISVVHEIIM